MKMRDGGEGGDAKVCVEGALAMGLRMLEMVLDVKMSVVFLRGFEGGFKQYYEYGEN